MSSSADFKHALRAYVLGRDSAVSSEVKRRRAAESLRQEREARSNPAPAAPSDPEASPSVDISEGKGRFGVPVPNRLDFHRSASRWRDFIPGFKSGGA